MINNLTNIVIPINVETIGQSAFRENDIVNVTIPKRFENELENIFGESYQEINFTFI